MSYLSVLDDQPLSFDKITETVVNNSEELVLDIPTGELSQTALDAENYQKTTESYQHPTKVCIVGDSMSPTLEKEIGKIVVAYFGGSVSSNIFDNSIGFNDFYQQVVNMPVEWRWTELHHQLAWEGTMEKYKRQQQRQKALFKHYEAKRIKKGRSHAKQKHKGMARYA